MGFLGHGIFSAKCDKLVTLGGMEMQQAKFSYQETEGNELLVFGEWIQKLKPLIVDTFSDTYGKIMGKLLRMEARTSFHERRPENERELF